MRENDRTFKELQEQEKKINEVKEIVKYYLVVFSVGTSTGTRTQSFGLGIQRFIHLNYGSVFPRLNKEPKVCKNMLHI